MHGAKTILILAGPMCSGKSTILHNALQRRSALFGEYSRLLTGFTPLPVLEEPGVDWRIAPRTALQVGGWVSESHVPALLHERVMPTVLLMHFDFMHAVGFKRGSYTSFRDPGVVAEKCEAFLGPLLRRFGFSAMNTVLCPLPVAVEWWKKRKRDLPSMNVPNAERIYDRDAPDESTYEALYEGWRLFLNARRPGAVFLTQLGEDQQELHIVKSAFPVSYPPGALRARATGTGQPHPAPGQ